MFTFLTFQDRAKVEFFIVTFLDNKLKFNASHPGADVLKLTVFLNRHLNAPPDAEALRVFGPHLIASTRC